MMGTASSPNVLHLHLGSRSMLTYWPSLGGMVWFARLVAWCTFACTYWHQCHGHDGVGTRA